MKDAPSIQIGIDEKAVDAVRESIMDILGCGQDQDTIKCALDTFTKATSVNNTTISNCNFA